MSRFTINLDTISMNLICLLCMFMFCFLPTSRGTHIKSLTVFVWAVATVTVIFVGLINGIYETQMAMNMLFVLGYMSFVTIMAKFIFGQSHVSLYRIAPIVAVTFLSHVQLNKQASRGFMRFLLNLFSIICIIWNVGILSHFQPIVDFTYNNYNQYFPLAVFYSVHEQFKPVMTFGVHTYAAFYYLIFFLLCYYTYEYEEKIIYLVYSIFYTFFCLFLVSTTGVIYFVCMIIFLIYKQRNRFNIKSIIFLILLAAVFGLIIFKNFDYLYSKLFNNMTNGSNSFISRYSDESVFVENFKIITSSFGIGFNILDNVDVGYSDSGVVVYLTMGSIPLCLFMYRRIYGFICNNISSYYAIPLFIAIMSFEFALPATFVYRFVFMIIFVLCYYNTLYRDDMDYEY